MVYRWLFPFLRLAFIVVWIMMAHRSRWAERESVYLRLSHCLPLAIAIDLLAPRHVPVASLGQRVAPLALWLVRLTVDVAAAPHSILDFMFCSAVLFVLPLTLSAQ